MEAAAGKESTAPVATCSTRKEVNHGQGSDYS